VRGRAEYDQQTGRVRAEAEGQAPNLQGGGVLGAPVRSTGRQFSEQGESGQPATPGGQRALPGQVGNKPTLAGRVLGLLGLVIAAILLRNRSAETA
jgi:hypothetical protein